MKILFLTAYSYPEQTPSSYLGKNRNNAFYEQGWHTLVYTPTPSRGITKEQRRKYCTTLKNEVLHSGQAVVHRLSLYAEGKNSILRAFRYLLLCCKLFWCGAFRKEARKADVLFVSSTPPIMGATATLVKKFNKIPFIYNLQDIFPDSLVGTGLAKKGGILWKIGRVIENFTYRNADKIIVISEDFKRNIMAKGVPEDKIVVVYNWVDEQAVVDVPREENKLFDKYHLDRNKFYVTYCGNIGLTQNLDMLVAASEELSDNNDIHFVLVGNGAYWETLVAKLKEKRTMSGCKAEDGTEALTFGNITLLPFQPYDDISHVFSLGDVSIIISKPGVGANSVPSKTWSIMSASRPVIANFDENEIKSILDDNRCGIFTKAGDKEAFKQAIFTLYNDKELCQEYGRNGRQFVMDNLTKEVGTQKYVEVIKETVANYAKDFRDKK